MRILFTLSASFLVCLSGACLDAEIPDASFQHLESTGAPEGHYGSLAAEAASALDAGPPMGSVAILPTCDPYAGSCAQEQASPNFVK